MRIDGNRYPHPSRGFWKCVREVGLISIGFGVCGPGEFHSSEWRSAEHVDNRAALSSAAAFCAMGSAPGTTNSYAAIGL